MTTLETSTPTTLSTYDGLRLETIEQRTTIANLLATLTWLGEQIKDHAEENGLCSRYDDAVEELAESNRAGISEFVEAAARMREYLVTTTQVETWTVTARSESHALATYGDRGEFDDSEITEANAQLN